MLNFVFLVIKIGIKCNEVDAIEYYSSKLEKVKVEFDNELQNESARTGIVFVTVHEVGLGILCILLNSIDFSIRII